MIKLGRYTEALDVCQKLLVYAGSNTEKAASYWLFGQAKENQGNRLKALRDYELASRMDPTNPKFIMSRASLHMVLEEPEKAAMLIKPIQKKIKGHSNWEKIASELNEKMSRSKAMSD